MNNSTLAYLASPYSRDPQVGYDAALRFCANARLANLNVFSPIVYCHHIAKLLPNAEGFGTWEKLDLEMLSRCDTLIVLTIDGWKESVGVQAEILYAQQHGISVVYAGVDSPLDWHDRTEQPMEFDAWCHQNDIEKKYRIFREEYGDAAGLLSDYKLAHYEYYVDEFKKQHTT